MRSLSLSLGLQRWRAPDLRHAGKLRGRSMRKAGTIDGPGQWHALASRRSSQSSGAAGGCSSRRRKFKSDGMGCMGPANKLSI